MILAYRHTGVNVTDLARSVAFYESLGFVVVERRHEEGAYIDALTGLSNVSLDWVKVEAPNGVLLELVRFRCPDRVRRFSSDYASIGCNHLCLQVDNVEAMHRELSAAGVRCHPVQTDPPGKVKNMACYDPDGTIIELVEVLK